MSSAQVGAVLRHLHRLGTNRVEEAQSDRQLLERFARQRDGEAFSTLLRRHGAMVLGVCRGVLHDRHDAEDAFQATFLVLAQKAGSIQQQESVAGWLYRVAYHLAVKTQASAARRRVRERQARPLWSADPFLDISLRELRGVLYEELGQLPEQYRAPLVLCYLEEKTLDEAAHLLGCSRGAVKGSLERGRDRLRSRLARRGLALSEGLLAASLARHAAATKVPAVLAATTLKVALLRAAGDGAALALVSAAVPTLIEGATRTMLIRKLKVLAILLVAIACGSAGLGLLTHRALAARAAATSQAGPPRPAAREQDPQAAPARAAGKEAVAVHGRVLDPDGQPVAGAKLYL